MVIIIKQNHMPRGDRLGVVLGHSSGFSTHAYIAQTIEEERKSPTYQPR
jgi:hypothetical protein